MKFAVWPSYDRSWEETLTLATWAAEHDFGGFWYADHILEYGADDERGHGPVHECWSVLAAVGAVVPNLRLVSMVSPVTIHHPVVLTKRAITVDHISGGRAVLGIGAGWQVNEHLAYGFELPPPRARVDRFEEAIQVTHFLAHGEQVSFHGAYFQLDGVACYPRPVDRLPILVGTGSPRMLRITARFADEWNTWGHPDQLAQRGALFERACQTVGRDPATMRRSAQAMVHLVDDAAQRAAAEAANPANVSLVGGANELVDLLGRVAEMGVEEFGLPDDSFGDTPEQRLESLQRIHAEVLTQLT